VSIRRIQSTSGAKAQLQQVVYRSAEALRYPKALRHAKALPKIRWATQNPGDDLIQRRAHFHLVD
jgi:hypothetical protein